MLRVAGIAFVWLASAALIIFLPLWIASCVPPQDECTTPPTPEQIKQREHDAWRERYFKMHIPSDQIPDKGCDIFCSTTCDHQFIVCAPPIVGSASNVVEE